VSGDIAWLASIGVEGLAERGPIADTQAIAAGIAARSLAGECGRLPRGQQLQKSLQALASEHGLAPERLHNGANDAMFTLQVLLCQCGVSFSPPQRREFDPEETSPRRTSSREEGGSPGSTQVIASQTREWEEQLIAFHDSLGKGNCEGEIRFPPSLNSRQRWYLHTISEDLGLSSRSIGKGNDRQLIVRAKGATVWTEEELQASKEGSTPKTQRRRHYAKKEEKHLRKNKSKAVPKDS